MSVLRATKAVSMCDFVPAKLDGGFIQWAEKGLVTVNQFFEGKILKVFSQLQAQYGITSNELFKYVQIQHYLMTHKDCYKIRQVPTIFEQYWIEEVENQTDTGKIISSLCRRIHTDLSGNTLDVKK